MTTHELLEAETESFVGPLKKNEIKAYQIYSCTF